MADELVMATLHVEYTHRDTPHIRQTMTWQTFDTPPGFPRTVEQLRGVELQEGVIIKDWRISNEGPVGPAPTHEMHHPRSM